MKEKCGILCQLAGELNAIVLKTIKAVMRDRNLLEELSGKASRVSKHKDCYVLSTHSCGTAHHISTQNG